MTIETRSGLSMTARDHRAMGSTPPEVLVQNPGKTLAETMRDADIFEMLRTNVDLVKDVREVAKQSDQKMLTFIRAYETLILDVQHLREIDRMPKEFTNLDLRELAL